MPVDVFVTRRPRVDLRVRDARTGRGVNAFGFHYSVSEMREETVLGRTSVTEVEIYRGRTKSKRGTRVDLVGCEAAGGEEEDEEEEEEREEEGEEEEREEDDEDQGEGLAAPFDAMYVSSQGGEYAVRVWSDDDAVPAFAAGSARQVRHIGGVTSAGGAGGALIVHLYTIAPPPPCTPFRHCLLIVHLYATAAA